VHVKTYSNLKIKKYYLISEQNYARKTKQLGHPLGQLIMKMPQKHTFESNKEKLVPV
jgi:hypothetical protein